MRAYRVALAAAALAVSIGTVADAQTMRGFQASRPARGERMLRATLEFGAGEVVVQPGQKDELYRMQLRYDADRSAPTQDYDPRTGILRFGLESVGRSGVRVTSRAQREQSGRFEFSPDIPLSLTANLGAADATIDLGGTTLVELAIRSGATRGTVSFSRPTKGECKRASFTVGASELEVQQLAAAGCAEVRVEGGVGRAILAFDGAWRRDVNVVAALAMGGLTLRVPKGTGLRIAASRFLTTFDAQGLVKDGNTWVTPNFATARRKVSVELSTSMAGVNVEWTEH